MPSPPPVYRFGPFSLDRAGYRLFRQDETLALPPKVIDLLFLLISRPGTMLTKDEILAALWPDVAVTDNAITQVVSELRRALGDAAARPRYVQTVPRRGYRFIAPVEVAARPAEAAPAAGPSASGIASGAMAPPSGGRVRPGAGQPSAVVVLEFVNVSGDSETGWLGAGIAEAVTGNLRVIADLRVVDRGLVTPADRQLGMADARSFGLDLVVVGSFQRSGARLRITARVIDVASGTALVHAKADGDMLDVFGLQDAIVRQLVAELRLNLTPAAEVRLQARETSSLDAYRALTEGRLLLEALDPAEIPAAVASFQRAITFDPGCALAHCGLAHARFWRYQASRARIDRVDDELARAIAHAEQAVAIDPDLAEAHASLALFLGPAGRSADAVAAGRRAITLEPGNWRHLFRFGIAAWGEERLAALGGVIGHFPKMAHAHFGVAMVHIARGDLAAAHEVLERSLAAAGGAMPGLARLPAGGLRWLDGLIRLTLGDTASAREAFEAELGRKGSRLFADEYAVGALEGLGAVRLLEGDARRAIDAFEQALSRLADRPASLVGLAAAARAAGERSRADAAIGRARAAVVRLREAGRVVDAAMAEASLAAATGDRDGACATLARMLADAPPGYAGWSIPVEPLLTPLRGAPAFRPVLRRLQERAST